MISSKRTASDYMATEVIVLEPTSDIHAAMQILLDHGISSAPVVGPTGDVVGILTEKDCFRAVYESNYHREVAGDVSQYMSRQVVTMDANADIIAVVETFFRSPYRRFPVMTENRLVGLISRRDVLRALAELW